MHFMKRADSFEKRSLLLRRLMLRQIASVIMLSDVALDGQSPELLREIKGEMAKARDAMMDALLPHTSLGTIAPTVAVDIPDSPRVEVSSANSQ